MVKPGGDEESGRGAIGSRASIRSVDSDLSSPPASIRRNSRTTLDEILDLAAANSERYAPLGIGTLDKDELDVENLDVWIWNTYGRRIVTKVRPWVFNRKDAKEERFEVSLAEVQRIRKTIDNRNSPRPPRLRLHGRV